MQGHNRVPDEENAVTEKGGSVNVNYRACTDYAASKQREYTDTVCWQCAY